MAEPIEIPFGMWTWASLRNYALDGVQIRPQQGTFVRGMTLGFTRMLSTSVQLSGHSSWVSH